MLARKIMAVSALCILAIAIFPSVALSAYISPKVGGFSIDMELVALTAEQRSELAGSLATYARNTGGQRPGDDGICTKLLGVALLLDPRCKSAVVVNMKFKRGERPSLVPTKQTPRQLAAAMIKHADALLARKGVTNPRLAGYLLSLATAIDSRNDDVIYAYEMYIQDGKAVKWDEVFGGEKPEEANPEPVAASAENPAASGEAPSAPERIVLKSGPREGYIRKMRPFVKRQGKVNGLVVLDTWSGARSGSVLEMIVSVYNTADPKSTRWTISERAGKEMVTSLEEAVNAMRVRYPNWQGGTELKFSFSDKYSEKDGGSAGMAFALLLVTLLDGIEIDPDACMTGDITVDWKVRNVGGIPDKIEGAIAAKSKYIAVPHGNTREVLDAVLLNSPSCLWDIQIFSVSDLSQAAETLRTDRLPKLQEAIDRFAKVQVFLAKKGVVGLRDAALRKELNEILVLAPNLLSVSVLIDGIEHKLPRRLSLTTSIDETLAAGASMLPIALQTSLMDSDAVTDVMVKSCEGRLKKISPMIDEKSRGLHASLTEFVGALKKHRGFGSSSSGTAFTKRGLNPGRSTAASSRSRTSSRQPVIAASKKVRGELQRLSMDTTILNALSRQ